MRRQMADLNARSWSIPSVLLRIALSLVLSAIVLALLVPALHANGQPLRGWVVWGVILGALSLAIVPGLWVRFRQRRSA
jgi:hypothetical protein